MQYVPFYVKKSIVQNDLKNSFKNLSRMAELGGKIFLRNLFYKVAVSSFFCEYTARYELILTLILTRKYLKKTKTNE